MAGMPEEVRPSALYERRRWQAEDEREEMHGAACADVDAPPFLIGTAALASQPLMSGGFNAARHFSVCRPRHAPQ